MKQVPVYTSIAIAKYRRSSISKVLPPDGCWKYPGF